MYLFHILNRTSIMLNCNRLQKCILPRKIFITAINLGHSLVSENTTCEKKIDMHILCLKLKPQLTAKLIYSTSTTTSCSRPNHPGTKDTRKFSTRGRIFPHNARTGLLSFPHFRREKHTKMIYHMP